MSRKRAANGDAKVLKLDVPLDAFDCPICQVPMTKTIMLCPAGHNICEDCFNKLAARKCPACAALYPAVVGRNRSLEALAANCTFPCIWGCGFEDKPEGLRAHAGLCTKVSVKCFVYECAHECPRADLQTHIQSAHKVEVNCSELDKSGARFVLSNGDEVPSTDSDYGKWTQRLFHSTAVSVLWSAELKDGVLKALVQHLGAPLKFSVKMHDPRDDHSVATTGFTAPYDGQTETGHQIWVNPELAPKLWTRIEGTYDLYISASFKPL